VVAGRAKTGKRKGYQGRNDEKEERTLIEGN
jgi:hypothetical protein